MKKEFEWLIMENYEKETGSYPKGVGYWDVEKIRKHWNSSVVFADV